jgi:MFS family permease
MVNDTESNEETLTDEQRPLLGSSKPTNNGTINGDPERQDELESRPDDDDVAIAEEHTTMQLVRIMSAIWLGSFLAALDGTIVATLSGPIATSFNSLSLLSWLASAYFIANAALQPLSGKLTDIFGRRAGLIFSNVFFAAGNLICGLAKEEWIMVFGRVVAGMGGGGLNAISTFVASDLVPLRKRGVWQGVGNIIYGIGAGLGGLFGGWMNDTYGWRWAFLLQVPMTIISGLMVWFLVKIPVQETDRARWKRIDWLGALTLTTTLVLLLLGLNSGGNVVPWDHPLVLTSLPLSAVCLLAFIYVESSYAEEPIIPVHLLLDRTVLSACLTNWFMTMAIFGLLFYGPIYFQIRGYSATQAGVRLIPSSLGIAVGSIVCGIVIRWLGRYYALNIAIQAIFLLAMSLVSTFTLETPTVLPFIYFFLAGFGYSGTLTTTLIALIAAVEHKHQAVITAASYAFRSTGSTIGITIASSVFQNLVKTELWERFGDRKDAAEIIRKIRDSLEEIKNLPPSWKEGVQEVYMDALRGVFMTLVGLAVLSAAVSMLMREHKLYKTIIRRPSTTS